MAAGGGNPAFLLESVKLLLSTGGDDVNTAGGPLPLPASIEAVIERRLSLLSPRARQLVQLAAIAGSGYSIPLAASCAAQDWPNALPAMSNLGVMYYWRGENAAAHEVLASARAQREQLYGGGAGIKIDTTWAVCCTSWAASRKPAPCCKALWTSCAACRPASTSAPMPC